VNDGHCQPSFRELVIRPEGTIDLPGRPAGLDVRFRTVENLEIGLGGGIAYLLDENEFYSGPYVSGAYRYSR